MCHLFTVTVASIFAVGGVGSVLADETTSSVAIARSESSAASQPKGGKGKATVAGLKQLQGMASWYGPGFHGRRTASGERFNSGAMTAAHRNLPFGTQVRVTNLNNGRSVVVRINDRGPFIRGRVIDLSAEAARAIGMLRPGVAPVRIEVIGN